MNLTIKEETGVLRALHLLLHLFKFGAAEDDDKRLLLLGSPVLRSLFESVRTTYLSSLPEESRKWTDPDDMYIEGRPEIYSIVKDYLSRYKQGSLTGGLILA